MLNCTGLFSCTIICSCYTHPGIKSLFAYFVMHPIKSSVIHRMTWHLIVRYST